MAGTVRRRTSRAGPGPGGGKICVSERAEQRLDLVLRASHRRRRGDDLRPRPHRSSRPRSQSPSIAVSYRPAIVPSGPEIRCSSSWMTRSGGGSGARQRRALPGLGGAVEAVAVIPVRAAEQRARRRRPTGSVANLSTVAIEERGQPPVDRLVDGDDRERAIADEVAVEVRAHDPQLARLIVVGQQRERLRLEARRRTTGTPRAGSATACCADRP